VGLVSLAFTVTWDPGIRGILVVAVGVAVLCGSVYMLLATNTGNRLGFLLALTGLWGWMAIMGLIWWVYGIGYVGDAPSWKVKEVYTAEPGAEPHELSGAGVEAARDLSEGWKEIPAGDPSRGEAQAAADEALTGEDSAVKMFEATSAYVTHDAFAKGGKDKDNLLYEIPLLPHPTRYAVIQVQRVVETQAIEEGEECPPDTECYALGETPPKAEADEDQPIISVVMVRDLGSKRLPPALITLFSLVVFGVLCNILHHRDKEAAAARAGAKAGS
jgi:hypothetical protein